MSITQTPQAADQAQPRRRRSGASAWLTALLLVVGATVFLYPSAASWFSSVLQSQQSEGYVSAVQSLTPDSRDDALREAEAYNASLASGERVVDPFASPELTTVKTDDPYWGLLDPSSDGIMARLRVPSIDVNLPIYHGTGADVLRDGVGHLQGSALPVGGTGTHAVLTGHRGLPEATLFTHLDRVVAGDMIYFDVLGRTLAYRVTTSEVTLPTETDTLRPQAGQDLITLITCTPIGVNSHRILVTAERVTPAPVEATVVQSAVGFPWWMVFLGGAFLVAGIYLAVALRSERRKERDSAVRATEGVDATGPTAGAPALTVAATASATTAVSAAASPQRQAELPSREALRARRARRRQREAESGDLAALLRWDERPAAPPPHPRGGQR